MRYTYITALLDIKIKGIMKSPLEIKTNTYVTNNPSHIKKFLYRHVLMSIGSLEANLLLSGAPVIYRIDDAVKFETSHEEIINLLREVQAFLTSLWLLQDNSANCELGFAFSHTDGHIHSNSLALNYSTFSGERSAMEIDHTQLVKVIDICRKNFAGIRIQDEPELTAFQRESGRAGFSMLFLQQARSSNDLGQKIANYCSYFEALLSTNSIELSHQLSERAAFLLRTSPEERFEHFKQTKRAYAIRSKVVHGDAISKKQIPDLKDIANHCDKMARELLMTIIESNELNALFNSNDNEALDNFMLKRIFGISGSQAA